MGERAEVAVVSHGLISRPFVMTTTAATRVFKRSLSTSIAGSKNDVAFGRRAVATEIIFGERGQTTVLRAIGVRQSGSVTQRGTTAVKQAIGGEQEATLYCPGVTVDFKATTVLFREGAGQLVRDDSRGHLRRKRHLLLNSLAKVMLGGQVVSSSLAVTAKKVRQHAVQRHLLTARLHRGIYNSRSTGPVRVCAVSTCRVGPPTRLPGQGGQPTETTMHRIAETSFIAIFVIGRQPRRVKVLTISEVCTVKTV